MAEESNPDWRSLGQFPFGDSPELANELAELVLAGQEAGDLLGGERGAEDACRPAMGRARRRRCPGRGSRDDHTGSRARAV